MLDAFKAHIKKSMKAYILENYSNVRVDRRTSRNRLVFRIFGSESADIYIVYRFVNSKNVVLPKILWSKIRTFPSEACLSEEELAVRDIKELDLYDEVVVTPCEFGKSKDYYELDRDGPSAARLNSIINANDTALAGVGLTKSEILDNSIYHSWKILEELFPNVVTTEDITSCTSILITELVDLLDRYFVPYAIDVIERNE